MQVATANVQSVSILSCLYSWYAIYATSFLALSSPVSPRSCLLSPFSLCLELSYKQEAAWNNEVQTTRDVKKEFRKRGRGFRVQFFHRWTWNVDYVVTAITDTTINVIYPHVLGWE